MEVDIETRCKNYFHNLNPIAQKFAKDIENTREAYQDLWSTLSKEDQDQVVDESIITPAAVLKYAHIQVSPLQDSSNTYSWFTKSQLNIFSYFKDGAFVPDSNARQFSSTCVRDTSKKDGVDIEKREGIEEKKHLLVSSRLLANKSSILKPKSPPPPPPSVKTGRNSVADQKLSVLLNETDALSNDIPKTGFDFLDNW